MRYLFIFITVRRDKTVIFLEFSVEIAARYSLIFVCDTRLRRVYLEAK